MSQRHRVPAPEPLPHKPAAAKALSTRAALAGLVAAVGVGLGFLAGHLPAAALWTVAAPAAVAAAAWAKASRRRRGRVSTSTVATPDVGPELAMHRPWHGQPPGPAALDTFDPSRAVETICSTPATLRALAAGSDLRRQADALITLLEKTDDPKQPPASTTGTTGPEQHRRILSDTEVLARSLVLTARARAAAAEDPFDAARARTVLDLLPDALAATGHSDSHQQVWAHALRDAATPGAGTRAARGTGTAVHDQSLPGGDRWLQVAHHEALKLLTSARARQHRAGTTNT